MKRHVARLLLLVFLGPIELSAADLSGRIGAGLIETDNVERFATGAMSATIEEVTSDLALHEQTRRIDADVISNLQYLRYANQFYSNEVLGNFIGNGKFAFVPGEAEWLVQDNFGQQQLNPGSPVTPTNLENINYFSTGPNLLIPMGPQLKAQLSALYSRVTYQTSDLNSNRSDASVGLVHPLSTTSDISLRAATEKVRYNDTAANPDFSTQEGYLHYDTLGGRSKMSLDLGYDYVTGLSTRSGGTLVRADVSREISASSRLELSAGQDLSDTGNLLRQLQSSNGVAVNAGSVSLQRSNDPFTNRYASLAWKFERNRTAFTFDVARYQELHVDNSSFNQTRYQADVSLRRTLSPMLTAAVGATYARATFNDSVDNFRDVTALAALEWRFARRLDVRAEYDRFDHTGDVEGNKYIENRIAVTLGLRVGSVL
jgi:hypothetical protein